MRKTNTIFGKSDPGVSGVSLPKSDVPNVNIDKIIDDEFIRIESPNIPEVPESQVVRHYIDLSNKNYHIDKNFYPLGSCTMKYNPKINEVVASLDSIKNLHPDQPVETVQGAMELIYELEQILKKITGMSRCTLQPSAGAQGELAGAMVIKQYHIFKGNDKNVILVPDSAHGTNPATVVRVGYKTRVIKSDSRGRVDIDDLKKNIDSKVAGLMLTQPNTLGLFEDNIQEITKLIHDVDGLVYMDGANLNALVGIVRPADMGFDITHMNLHKTFSTPHGGGGPGSGPIGVVEKLVPFLPVPVIDKKDDGSFYWNYNYPNSIGRLHGQFGNFGILVRAFTYIKMLGDRGLREMSSNAVLNANYLKSLIEDKYDVPYTDGIMHEFVISGIKQKKRGTKVLDIAKKILDEGYHSPTIYFPINVPEAMMIEPTETETKKTLDEYASTLITIDKLVDDNPDELRDAPITTPVQRLNEAQASRSPDVRWDFEISD